MTESKGPNDINAQADHRVEEKTMDSFSKKLAAAKEELENTDKRIELQDTNTGDIKKYTPVAVRVDIFRKHFGFSGRIMTKIKEKDEDNSNIVMEATLDILMDGKFVRIANAYSNKTRYQAAQTQVGNLIETSETSAIGRVLANIGLAGGEFASLEDLVSFKRANSEEIGSENLPIQKPQKEEIESLLKEKNYTFEELMPKHKSIDDLNYLEAGDLINELEQKPKKRTTKRRNTTKANAAKTKASTSKTKANKIDEKDDSSESNVDDEDKDNNMF